MFLRKDPFSNPISVGIVSSLCRCLFPSERHLSLQVVRMNSLTNTSAQCQRDTSVTSVVFPCLYSLLFLSALVLNSLAAWIFFNIPSTSTFVVYLKNVVRKHKRRIWSPGGFF